MQKKVRWLTVPVHCYSNALLRDVKISQMELHKSMIGNFSSIYPHRADKYGIATSILQVIAEFESDKLLELNLRLLRTVWSLLGMPEREWLLASQITAEPDRTKRIVKICKSLNASELVCGWGGTVEAHEVKILEDSGISLVSQSREFVVANTTHPIEGLSIVHPMYYLGPDIVRGQVLALTHGSFGSKEGCL